MEHFTQNAIINILIQIKKTNHNKVSVFVYFFNFHEETSSLQWRRKIRLKKHFTDCCSPSHSKIMQMALYSRFCPPW